MALLPLGEEAAAGLLAGIAEEERRECWWLVLRDGTPVPGDRGGGVVLLTELRPTRPWDLRFGRYGSPGPSTRSTGWPPGIAGASAGSCPTGPCRAFP